MIPKSREEAKKIIASLGIEYNTIHACINDCILYRGEYEKETTCPKCGVARFKAGTLNVPMKVLHHFPLVPRVQHIFRCPEIAKLMDWSSRNASTDGVMRIPSNCQAFKHIDATWPEFCWEPRHIKFGVGLDGINPFSMRSSKWSTWPVVLINYNIPPFMSIKKEHLILSLLIPGM